MPLLNRALRLAALFFILLLAAMPALTDHFARSTMDPDFWWHVRVGEWSLHHHGVPHSGILSQHSSLLLATVIGPYWGAMYGTILRYASWGQQYYQIRALLAMDFRNMNDYFVVVLLILGCIAIGRRGLDLFTGSLILSAAMVTFRSRRDVWFVSLLACALVAAAIDGAERPASTLRFSRLAQYAGVLLLAIAAAYGYALGGVGLSADNLIGGIDARYPVRATEYVRQHHLPGPMYNTFEWGGFLIFNLREYDPSIDGRYDLYGPALCQRNFDALNAIAWKHDPDLAKAGFVLLPKRAPLNDALAADPDYRLIYSDHIAKIFVKTSAAEHPASGR